MPGDSGATLVQPKPAPERLRDLVSIFSASALARAEGLGSDLSFVR
jgi:hypothetical protein